LIFSPARRGRDNTTKHTYENVLEVQEVVINMVSYSMVQQMSLASTEYPKGINEFQKAGFTEVASTLIKPPRVAEAPVSMECNVLQIVPTGTEGGAGNLVICEVILMHIKEEVLDAQGKIDPFKLDAVARLGGDWYCRVQGDAIFKVPKPLDRLGIGVDSIPAPIRYSKVLTGNDLGLLGNIERLPDITNVQDFFSKYPIEQALQAGEDAVHTMARIFLSEGKTEEAWKVLLLSLR
jgi:flavin reductase (DIM6/NTAB) family NADH-FMN oxidoreductase RutF